MGSVKPQSDFDPETELLPRAGLRDQVAQRILAAIFERAFPDGTRLVVQRLAERFGVSPTPVREALVELAGLGIVELLPNRGAVVKPFGSQQLHHISQVRRVLEMEACRSACGHIPMKPLMALRERLAQLRKMRQNDTWDRDARLADSQLHLLIAEHCGNPRLAQEIKRYLFLFRAIRNVSHLHNSWDNYRRSNDVPEHLEIVDALIANNLHRATKATDRHIRSITNVLNDVVFPETPAKNTPASSAMFDRRTRRSGRRA